MSRGFAVTEDGERGCVRRSTDIGSSPPESVVLAGAAAGRSRWSSSPDSPVRSSPLATAPGFSMWRTPGGCFASVPNPRRGTSAASQPLPLCAADHQSAAVQRGRVGRPRVRARQEGRDERPGREPKAAQKDCCRQAERVTSSTLSPIQAANSHDAADRRNEVGVT